MKIAPLFGAALVAWTMQAGAVPSFEHCAAGPPRMDVQGRPLPASLWQLEPTLVVFWSVDCAYCHRHNERLSRLVQELPGTSVLGVALRSEPEAVREAVRGRGTSFPVIVDGSGDCALHPQLTSRSIVPMTCWLGASPAPPRCIPGEMSEEDLRELLLLQLRSRRHS